MVILIPFEPYLSVQHYMLRWGKGFLTLSVVGQPPIVPVVGYRLQVRLSFSTQVGFRLFMASIAPTNKWRILSSEPFSGKTEIRPQGRWDQVGGPSIQHKNTIILRNSDLRGEWVLLLHIHFN